MNNKLLTYHPCAIPIRCIKFIRLGLGGWEKGLTFSNRTPLLAPSKPGYVLLRSCTGSTGTSLNTYVPLGLKTKNS